MLRRKPHALHIQQDPQRPHHALKIQQRLALPHQHHICPRRQPARFFFSYVAVAVRGGRFFHGLILLASLLHLLQRHQNLRHHLPRRQIPDQSQLRRQAKLAIHRATRLCRNTNRLPPLARHEHCFHRRQLLHQLFFLRQQPEQIPHRRIRRNVSLPHCRQSNLCLALQFLPQRRRQIAPPLNRKLPLRIQPVINLVRTVSRFAQPLAVRLKLFPIFPQQFQALVPHSLHSLTQDLISVISSALSSQSLSFRK